MEKEYVQLLTVDEVYDQAASIGEDIEHIVSKHGIDIVETLMPKIITTFAQFEEIVNIHADDRAYIQQLIKERANLVIQAKSDEAIKRQLREELAYKDELLSGKKSELNMKVKQLERENFALNDELDRRESEMVALRSHDVTQADTEVLLRLNMTICEQREEIRRLNEELFNRKDNEENKSNLSLQKFVAYLTDKMAQLRQNLSKVCTSFETKILPDVKSKAS